MVVHLMIKIKDQESENVARTEDERDMIVTDPVCSRLKKYPEAGCESSICVISGLENNPYFYTSEAQTPFTRYRIRMVTIKN